MAELVITGLEPVKRKKGWFELTIKGKPPFYIDEETIFKKRLVSGEIISDAQFKQIKKDSDIAWLKYRALQVLSRRMISERDLRRKLSSERKSSELREEVLTQLKNYGYIDDTKYACAYIRSQMVRGSKSRLYLKKKLFEKGIKAEISESALHTELAEYDESRTAVELGKKKIKNFKNLTPLQAKQKLGAFLKSRGFRWDAINAAVTELIDRNPEDN